MAYTTVLSPDRVSSSSTSPLDYSGRWSEVGIGLSRGYGGVRDSEIALSFLAVDWLLVPRRYHGELVER